MMKRLYPEKVSEQMTERKYQGKQKIGDYVNVEIYDCTAGTLKGKII